MKRNNFIGFLKKYSYFLFFLVFFSLSICTIVMRKNHELNSSKKNIEEFKDIVDNLKKKTDLVSHKQNFLKKNRNIYSVLIGVNLSKQLFQKKKYTQAADVLKKILLITQEENLIFYIKLNLVKIYVKKKDFSSALEIINCVNDRVWKPLFQEYRKYIYLRKRSI
ncbi:UPF0070 protein YfgM [Buchnera aphidicola (Cinara pseudotaxifoliae)]|uniref:Ancillary SecYEG translocon subunit n=1 Tax=Buchnera aphidicola (Cinara pseudotaxifoliae) TaxID=655384 RepID=A0A451DI30_9GAMM|nr:tetratricopeptide repeat protein [Buchnera aphidicola]VFP86306.1 UPF0070 protein YfgM [Buchnera aphidicola (Cinara pseudotaxifoliae)]